MSEQDSATTTADATQAGAESGATQTTDKGDTGHATPITRSDIDREIAKAVQSNMANMEAKQSKLLLAKEEEQRKAQMESDGRHKELLAETKAEVAALRAEAEAREYKLSAREAVDSMSMSRFAEVLITSNVEPIETTRERAERLKDIFESELQARMEKALDTGSNVHKNTNAPPPKDMSTLSGEDWVAERKRRGLM